MTTEIKNDTCALLVMDVQPGILERIENPDAFLEKAKALVHSAHEKKIQVIFVVVGFRPGAPEANARQREMGSTTNAGLVNPQPAISPEGDDIVVTKRRVSAFSGSDLEVILRAQDVRHIVLAGISTSGVVLSTTREASDKDFTITILSDLCADMDQEVHTVLTTKVFPRQATVMTSEEWLARTL